MSRREEIASIELQLDVQGIVGAVEEVSKAVEIVGKLAVDISSSISDVFTSALANIEALTIDVGILSNSLESIKEWDLSSVSRELSNISDALGEILKKLQEPDWLTMIDLAMQVYGMSSQGGNGKTKKTLFGGYNGKYTAGKGKYESGETILFGKASGKYSADSSTEGLGIAAGGIGFMDSGLTDAISDITKKFKGSAAATWLQNAATTAWKGISTAATAVTTAFGAAMNFLTSPIGLVVIGITALIAIIVLLIANWDTVKEWFIKGWEAIKNALSTAAEWFNNTIIQPIVGFFTNAMNWISTKVQEGFAFVQSIFMGVNEFLQNIFAKDWTEQFGAFGNVLNAFFANVENIWNAIKTVFSGIVTFVKSVFAGDWQAAWDGIVGIFSGIWEGIVAYVKVPINAIIGFINGLISGIVGGINLVIGALNHICVEIPDWDIFGSLAGKRFGFDFALLNAPQIPYLAKGAVLPANKPFLAMVGDQKHGTNVEAPLATIQEAVANVMVDMIPAMMAGFEAVVNEQRATRQAVESIELGDTVIGQAAARYSRKMAVIKGG